MTHHVTKEDAPGRCANGTSRQHFIHFFDYQDLGTHDPVCCRPQKHDQGKDSGAPYSSNHGDDS